MRYDFEHSPNKDTIVYRDQFDNEIANVGAYTYSESLCIRIWGTNGLLTIGKYCSLSDDISFFLGGNHPIQNVTTSPLPLICADGESPFNTNSNKDITVGNDVWIGSGAKLLNNITVGHGAVIGAMSVVTRDVPPYAVVAGNPARLRKFRFPIPVIAKLLDIAWWDWEPEKVKANAHLLCNESIDEFLALHAKA
jgi:acetyltransferase-like isoleucine patch superfamily enzyme